MQEGGPDVKEAQKIQRDRFKYAKTKYLTLDATAKARWAAANPEYHSYLFGYNFFMLEGLLGGGPEKYPQMIKSIQVIKQTMSKTGNTGFACNAVDPAKTVILINGNSQKYANVQRGEDTITDGGTNNHALSPEVDPGICEVIVKGSGGRVTVDVQEGTGSGLGDTAEPYASALTAAQLTVKMINTESAITAGYSWEVIEHVEATVYPVLVSIAAELVTLAWPIPPDVDADISITVVEYL